MTHDYEEYLNRDNFNQHEYSLQLFYSINLVFAFQFLFPICICSICILVLFLFVTIYTLSQKSGKTKENYVDSSPNIITDNSPILKYICSFFKYNSIFYKSDIIYTLSPLFLITRDCNTRRVYESRKRKKQSWRNEPEDSRKWNWSLNQANQDVRGARRAAWSASGRVPRSKPNRSRSHLFVEGSIDAPGLAAFVS